MKYRQHPHFPPKGITLISSLWGLWEWTDRPGRARRCFPPGRALGGVGGSRFGTVLRCCKGWVSGLYIAEGCLIRSSCLTEPAGTAAHLQAVFSPSVLHFPQHRRDQVLVGCVSPPAPISKLFLLDPSPSSLPISTPRWHLFQSSGILLLKQGSREQHHQHHLGAG